MDRTELLNAMRVIKDHCSTIQIEPNFLGTCHELCEIGEECSKYIHPYFNPEEWNLGDGESND